jgi:fumarate reductase flavoprotein subunit
MSRANHPFSKKPGDIHAIRDRLMNIMWDDVGIMRTADGLNKGIGRLQQLKAELMETGLDNDDLVFNLTWHDWMNVQSLIEISEIIAKAALSRENSRGAHFREDFPDEGILDNSYFTVARQKDTMLTVERAPVDFTIVKPGESLVDDMSPVQPAQ